MREKEIIIDKGQENAINATLKEITYPKEFRTAEDYYVEFMGGEKKRTRHTFSAKLLKKLLKNAEFVIVSAGCEDDGDIRFCFQPIRKSKNGKYYERLENVLSSFQEGDNSDVTQPINGIPRE